MVKVVRVFLDESLSTTIRDARLRKGIKSKDLAKLVEKSPAWMTRVENNQLRGITMTDAKVLERVLEIALCPDSSNDLAKQIRDLREENRRLKELLIKKYEEELAELETIWGEEAYEDQEIQA